MNNIETFAGMEVRKGWIVTIARDEVDDFESDTIDCYWDPEDNVPVVNDTAKYWNVIGKPRYGKIVAVNSTLVPTNLHGLAYFSAPKE